MQTITIENLIAFVCGFVVVYLMFRAMGVFVLALFLGLACSSAQSQVAITNWPDSSNPLPVYIAAQSTPDVWPSAAAGFGFGLTVCGFGLIYRMARRVGNDT